VLTFWVITTISSLAFSGAIIPTGTVIFKFVLGDNLLPLGQCQAQYPNTYPVIVTLAEERGFPNTARRLRITSGFVDSYGSEALVWSTKTARRHHIVTVGTKLCAEHDGRATGLHSSMRVLK
jgi:hypothetical protein